jgi:hypothetical protein
MPQSRAPQRSAEDGNNLPTDENAEQTHQGD